jgi:hypothetical protein
MHASDYGRELWQDSNAFFDSLPSDDKTVIWNTWQEGGPYHCEMPGVSNPQEVTLDWLEDRLDPTTAAPVSDVLEVGV